MNVQQLEQQLAAKQAEASDLLERLRAGAQSDNRVMTDAERTQVTAVLEQGKALKARVDRVRGDEALTSEINRMTGHMTAQRSGNGRSVGAQIVATDTFKWLREHRGRLPTGSWTSPSSEIMAATVTSDSASGGALIMPDHQPQGILPLPTRPLVMADLIASGQTESNLVTYMKELAWANAADAVAEGATKPESTLTFEAVSDPVRKIATWIPVTDEMLEDVPFFESYVNTRLPLGVRLAEDSELLSGSGIAPHLSGFLNRAGLATAVARGTDSNADAVLKQINAIFNATGLQPTGIVMNPTNFQTVQLMKTAAGEYISGQTPFAAPVGATLWGLPVALTSGITAGTALVGAFATAAQIFRKGGLRVESSNSHSDFFIKNLVAIRAEERLALAVYRPSAFGTVTGLN